MADLARVLDDRDLMRLASVAQAGFKLVEMHVFGALLAHAGVKLSWFLLLVLDGLYAAEVGHYAPCAELGVLGLVFLAKLAQLVQRTVGPFSFHFRYKF